MAAFCTVKSCEASGFVACTAELHRQASPTSAIPSPTSQPRPTCSRHSRIQETDAALVGQLHQEARNWPGMPWDPQPGTRAAPPVSYRARMPQPPSKGGMQPGLVTVKDLPSRQQASSESRPRLPTTTPAPRVRSLALVSRASQEKNRKEACLSEWQEILHVSIGPPVQLG